MAIANDAGDGAQPARDPQERVLANGGSRPSNIAGSSS